MARVIATYRRFLASRRCDSAESCWRPLPFSRSAGMSNSRLFHLPGMPSWYRPVTKTVPNSLPLLLCMVRTATASPASALSSADASRPEYSRSPAISR